KVTVEGLCCGLLSAIAFTGGVRHQRPDGALWLAFGCLPIKSVLLTRVTGEFLGILLHRVAIVGLAEVLVLRVSENTTDANGGQFVLADAAIENLLHACWRVEIPSASSILLQRD